MSQSQPQPKIAAGVERRYVPQELVELRATAPDDGPPRIRGHVAVFERFSPVYGWFREQIAPTFFDLAIERGDDVRGLFNHDPNFVLGRSRAKNMSLSKDDNGLLVDIEAAADSTAVRDFVLIPMRRGDVTGASFSFDLPPDGGDEWSKGDDGVWERTLLRIGTLYDVGPVTFPFYPDTDVAVRSAMHLGEAERAFQAWRQRTGYVENHETGTSVATASRRLRLERIRR